MMVTFEKFTTETPADRYYDKMMELVSQAVKRIDAVEEAAVKEIVKSHATPKINGDVTIGKMKWRGIKICYTTYIGARHIKVIQRGTQIGETIKIRFDI